MLLSELATKYLEIEIGLQKQRQIRTTVVLTVRGDSVLLRNVT